jgi:segregation and condensation protein B
MTIKDDRQVLEAALYASDHPLTMVEVKRIVGTSSETYAKKLVEELKSSYQRRGGPFSFSEGGQGTFSLKLKDDMMAKLGTIVPKVKVSKGALKTLAMIAYRQNFPLAKLAELRGSRTYEHVRQLVALGFVESKPYGKTRMLRTSKKFANYFGLEDDMDAIREWFEARAQ